MCDEKIKQVRELFTRMQDDWNNRTGEAEKRILQEYAENSKTLTFVYMGEQVNWESKRLIDY